jgi:hypothetical protein
MPSRNQLRHPEASKEKFLKIINHPPEKQKNNTAVNNSEIFWFDN